jgi:hypothetical protein
MPAQNFNCLSFCKMPRAGLVMATYFSSAIEVIMWVARP